MKVQPLWLVLAGLLLAGRLVAAPLSLDVRLTGFSYPSPVQTLSLNDQQQDLEMAYMDVAPKQGNGKTVLLLHGKNFSGAYWERTIIELLADGYRVVCRTRSVSASPPSRHISSTAFRPWRTTPVACWIP